MPNSVVYASALLEQLGINEVPDVRDIAAKLKVGIEEADVSGFDGALVRVKGTAIGTIAIRQSIREVGRKNFTIAHEIGHLILPGHDESAVCGKEQVEAWDPKLPATELEANQFAGELMIPARMVERVFGTPEPSLEMAEGIASTFSASLTASAYRFVELTSYRCALVWSSSGQVRWFKGSAEFAQWVRTREQVDKRTFAYGCFLGTAPPRSWEAVPANAWLGGSYSDDAVVLEQSVAMPFYDGVLTLLWIRDAIEARHDDNDELLEPLDPNDFGLGRKRWSR